MKCSIYSESLLNVAESKETFVLDLFCGGKGMGLPWPLTVFLIKDFEEYVKGSIQNHRLQIVPIFLYWKNEETSIEDSQCT